MDFSEDNDPMEELGDKPGHVETDPAPRRSEADDAELQGRRERSEGSVDVDIFPVTASSEGSLGLCLVSWTGGANAAALGDKPFTLLGGCPSAQVKVFTTY